MHPLIRILRPALAPTAAADVLAAAAICGGAPLERLLLGAGASLCLYMGGMAQNDLADLERDKALHPDRPLPSQPSLVPKARVLVFVLFAAGLGLGGAAGAFWPAVVVATFASAYNLGLKQIFPADVLSMGGARGAN
ncbi:MAG: UbiA family prenyltransferase, partial [Planctomycetota bacterium]|nr:UbiA family prenyltransferase [Planctomycetota bacterium]